MNRFFSAGTAACIIIFALWLIRPVLPVIVLAFLYAIVTWPVVRRLERKIPRGVGIVLVDLAFLVLAIAFMLSVAPAVYAQLQLLVASLPQAMSALLNALPEAVQNAVGSALRGFDVSASALLQQAVQTFVSVFRSVSAVAAAIVVIPVLAAYLQLDQERYRAWLLATLPRAEQERWSTSIPIAGRAVAAFIRGQLIVSAIVGVLVYIALLLCHVPFAGGIAILTALFDLVPYLGGVAAFVPSLLLAFSSNGTANALVVGVLLLLIFEAEAQFFGPMIVGAKTQLPPSLIVIVLLVGGALFGVLGLYLAVPVTAAIAAVGRARSGSARYSISAMS